MLKITTENTKSILKSSLKVFDVSIVLLWSLLCRDFNLSHDRLRGIGAILRCGLNGCMILDLVVSLN